MAVSSVHPLYSKRLIDWEQMRVTYQGERSVKDAGTIYLPATQGMVEDGLKTSLDINNPGRVAYEAYKTRAVFHDLVRSAVEYYIGLLHAQPAAVELPDVMKPLLENVTAHNEDMQQLLRRINEEQLVSGRLGLLADFPQNPTLEQVLPKIFLYRAEAIRNWDEGTVQQDMRILNLVTLDESEYVRQTNTFEWRFINKFRVLTLGPVGTDEAKGTYRFAIVEGMESMFTESDLKVPSIKGNTLDLIPFVFCNTKDVSPIPDNPPLLGLSNKALAIYRGEADYRQNLFMQGQDTLVVINGGDADRRRTGAGATLELKAGGDAKYIGVSSTGLTEQRNALENDLRSAEQEAGKVIDTRSHQKESGNALNVRLAAQTASLHQIALTGAGALERCLKAIARWIGADENKVKVTPNLQFADMTFTGLDALNLAQAKAIGFPLSQQSLHEIAADKGLTQYSFEDELALIEGETPLVVAGTDAGGNPSGPGPGRSSSASAG